jgi:hypothetical protein
MDTWTNSSWGWAWDWDGGLSSWVAKDNPIGFFRYFEERKILEAGTSSLDTTISECRQGVAFTEDMDSQCGLQYQHKPNSDCSLSGVHTKRLCSSNWSHERMDLKQIKPKIPMAYPRTHQRIASENRQLQSWELHVKLKFISTKMRTRDDLHDAQLTTSTWPLTETLDLGMGEWGATKGCICSTTRRGAL